MWLDCEQQHQKPLNDSSFLLPRRKKAKNETVEIAEVATEKESTDWIRKTLHRREYASAADAGQVQFWSPWSFVKPLWKECGFEILALRWKSIGKEEDLFGKRSIAKAKPVQKHLLRAFLPRLLRIWFFATHTTVPCRRLAEKTVIAAKEASSLDHPMRAGAGDCVA